MFLLLLSLMASTCGGADVGGGPLTTLNTTLFLRETTLMPIDVKRRLQNTNKDWVVFYNVVPAPLSFCWAWACPSCSPSTLIETAYRQVMPVEIDASTLSSTIQISIYEGDGSPTPCLGSPTLAATVDFDFHPNGVNIYGLGVTSTGGGIITEFRNPDDNSAHAAYFLNYAYGYSPCDFFFSDGTVDESVTTGVELGYGAWGPHKCDTFALYTSLTVTCGSASDTMAVALDTICADSSNEFIAAGNANDPAYPLTLLHVPGRRCDAVDSCGATAGGVGSPSGPPTATATSVPTIMATSATTKVVTSKPTVVPTRAPGCGSPPATATRAPTRVPGCPDGLYYMVNCPSWVDYSSLHACDDDDLSPGDFCVSRAGECGTNSNLGNCDGFAVYVAAQCVYHASGGLLKPAVNCPSDDTLRNLHHCANPYINYGDYCEGDGECGTSDSLDNCQDHDVYILGNECVNAGDLHLYEVGCPTEKDYRYMPHCAAPDLVAGDYCEGDGECGTNNSLNNCPDQWGNGSGYDIYLIAP